MTSTILLTGEEELVSTDRLNVAFVEDTSFESLNNTTTQTPTAIITVNTPEIIPPMPSPSTVFSPDSAVPPDEPCSTSKSSRSGRRVRFPRYLGDYYLY